MGFICEQVKVVPQLHESLPSNLRKEVNGLSKKFGSLLRNTELAVDASKINDAAETTPQEKETKLTELFKDSPYELIFTGEYE